MVVIVRESLEIPLLINSGLEVLCNLPRMFVFFGGVYKVYCLLLNHFKRVLLHPLNGSSLKLNLTHTHADSPSKPPSVQRWALTDCRKSRSVIDKRQVEQRKYNSNKDAILFHFWFVFCVAYLCTLKCFLDLFGIYFWNTPPPNNGAFAAVLPFPWRWRQAAHEEFWHRRFANRRTSWCRGMQAAAESCWISGFKTTGAPWTE